jgi:Tfp pilus assembly protein PilO
VTLNHNSNRWKRWARTAIALVLVLDAALVYANWRNASTATGAQRDKAANLAKEADAYEKDVDRAEAIKRHMPEVRQNCQRFYQEEFLPAATGYSSVIADFGELAGHAGLKTSGFAFKQHVVEKRGVSEIDIGATVEGDYPSLIHFINGLERSKNLYLLYDLKLASASTGSIRLQLELRTYFRS